MTVVERLATSLGRRDEIPNQELAQEIVDANDGKAIDELIENLSNKNKSIQSDCIKVLYEVGERNPKLIAGNHNDFSKLLTSKNNRLAWGAMTALDSITAVNPKGVHSLLSQIIKAADSGSVISRDHAVGILSKLAKMKEFASSCLPLLLEQLKKCPNNQFPLYSEMSLPVINETNRKAFVKLFMKRLGGLQRKSQKKRVERVLRKVVK